MLPCEPKANAATGLRAGWSEALQKRVYIRVGATPQWVGENHEQL